MRAALLDASAGARHLACDAPLSGPDAPAATMLHITNGDTTGDLLRAAVPGGEVLPWRDVLHEGPVPDLPLARLSPLRARFLADRGWAEYDAAMRDLARRDATLEGAGEVDEVVLWFEHDLYDQLQLLQLLDWFALHPPRRLTLVCIDAFAGVERFIGLGQLSREQIGSLFPGRVEVSAEQLELGRQAWAAFRAPRPTGLVELLDHDTSALPFLRPALLRLLEHFPSARDGLNRTERQMITLVTSGVREPRLLFRAHQELEEAPFLSDVVFFDYLAGLLSGDDPLLRRADHAAPLHAGPGQGGQATLVLTERGEAVREGVADRVAVQGIDRWIGGTHLRSPDAVWRWDAEAGTLDPR